MTMPTRANPRPASPRMVTLWLCAGCLAARAGASAATGDLQVINRVPSFLAFYAAAARPSVSEARRWALWRRDYGIAAVPPTPAGLALARRQLDRVWPRYAALVRVAGKLEKRDARDAQELLPRVRALIDPRGLATPVRLMLFAGQFDGNEFTAPPQKTGESPIVVMPVETPHIRYALAQELMHAVQIDVDHLTNGFAAPLGETILTVGLAMRGAQHILPGAPLTRYTWRSARWLAGCGRDSRGILRGIRPFLAASSPTVTTRFTYGTGTTGLASEAYCAGWIVVGHMLATGWTFPAIAHVPEEHMPTLVRSQIDATLQTPAGAPLPEIWAPGGHRDARTRRSPPAWLDNPPGEPPDPRRPHGALQPARGGLEEPAQHTRDFWPEHPHDSSAHEGIRYEATER
jgi:hypothetical protein